MGGGVAPYTSTSWPGGPAAPCAGRLLVPSVQVPAEGCSEGCSAAPAWEH